MKRYSYFAATALFLVLISGLRLCAQTASEDGSAGERLILSEASTPRDEEFIAQIRYAFTTQQWNKLSKLTGRERFVYAQNVLRQRSSECRLQHREHVRQADASFPSATLRGSRTDAGRFLIVWGKPQTVEMERISAGRQADGEARSSRAQFTRMTWIYSESAGAKAGETRVVVFSDTHSEGAFELQDDIFVPDDKALPTRSFSIEGLPLSVTWQQRPASADGGTYGSAQVANATPRELEVIVIVVAVNSYGRATAVGYQRVLIPGNTTRSDIRFGSQLPPGNYFLHADAVAEIPLLGLVYRANTHAAGVDVASR